jgi:predicted nucleic acid-binding protein
MILMDTSGVLSALFSDQRAHRACAEAIEQFGGPLILSPFVLAELDYLITKLTGVTMELRFLEEVNRGAYQLELFGARDIEQACKVLQGYRDLNIGLADASIVVLANRHNTNAVLTLDERHFRALSGPMGKPFRLLPADL